MATRGMGPEGRAKARSTRQPYGPARHLVRRQVMRRWQLRLRFWTQQLDELREEVTAAQRRLSRELGGDEPSAYSFDLEPKFTYSPQSAAEYGDVEERGGPDQEPDHQEREENQSPEDALYEAFDVLVGDQREPEMPPMTRINRELERLGQQRTTSREARPLFERWRENR